VSVSSIGLSGLSRPGVLSIIHIIDKETSSLTRRAVMWSIEIVI
jgi:hypothetical protein